MVVESTKSKKEIPGYSFRLAVGTDVMRSTLLTTVKKRGKVFHFEGHGWGHGVGLCQWGARGRALAGETYQKIIDIYYPNVRLVKAGVTEEQVKNNPNTHSKGSEASHFRQSSSSEPPLPIT